MPIRLTDNLAYPNRGTVTAAFAYGLSRGAKRQVFLMEYLSELYRLCQKYQLDFSILVAQSVNETDTWTSAIWNQYGNPAGIGVTGSDVSSGTNYSLVYKNGTDAARAHVVHMFAYVRGVIMGNNELHDYIDLDPRYGAVFEANYDGTIRRIQDFNVNGRWALLTQPPPYGTRIVNDGQSVWPGLPDQVDPPVEVPTTPEEPIPVAYNYNNGIVPPWLDYKVSEAAKYAGYIDPADHFIAACVVHSAYGTLEGTTGWYQGGNALTDTMVGNSLDGARLDGQIRRYNDAYGNRYAHSSGPVSNPIDDAAKFLEIFGPSPSAINMYTTAMERSCGSTVATNPVTEKEHASRVAWIAYHANRYGARIKAKTGKDGLTCDTFPLVTTENNRSFIIYHGEVNAGKRQTCPDPHVRATIDRMIADVRTLLAKWQKNADTIPPQIPPDELPEYAPVKPIVSLQAYKEDDKDIAPAIVQEDGKTYVFVNDRVEAIRDTKRRQTAEGDAKAIGPDIAKGTQFAVLWLFQDADGTPWYLTPWWTRIPVADTKRVKDAA
jgi:hypothetical protein